MDSCVGNVWMYSLEFGMPWEYFKLFYKNVPITRHTNRYNKYLVNTKKIRLPQRLKVNVTGHQNIRIRCVPALVQSPNQNNNTHTLSELHELQIRKTEIIEKYCVYIICFKITLITLSKTITMKCFYYVPAYTLWT